MAVSGGGGGGGGGGAVTLTPGGTAVSSATLAVTTTTASVTLPASNTVYPNVLLINDGLAEIFIILGGPTVTATTSNVPIPGGSSIQVSAGTANTVAAITSSGSSTLRVVQSSSASPFTGGGGGGGGSGGNVSIVSCVSTVCNPNGQAAASGSAPVVGATGTVAGASTGPPGTPSPNVVSVQGLSSGTPLPVNIANCVTTVCNLNGQAAASASAPVTVAAATLSTAAQTLAVTGTTANVALAASTTTYPVALLINDGSTEIFVNLGASGVTAATTNVPLPAGASLQTTVGAATNVAAITASGTSTLRIVQLTGAPAFTVAGGGGGGGGGNVNIQQWAGTTITNVPTAVGTAGTGNTPTVNAYTVGCISTVCNANGQAAAAGSQPVVGATGTIAGGTTGTAGSASTNVVTVQGIASGTGVPVVQSSGANLHVNCDAGCSSSSAPADESAFTFGTTSQTPIGGVFQTTATSNALTTGQMGAFQVTANRALFTNLRNASGTEIATTANPAITAGAGVAGTPAGGVLTVQGVASMTSLLVNPGTIGTWGLAASTQNVAAPTNGALVMGEFNTSPTTITTGNSSPLQMDASANLLVNVKTSVLPTGAATSAGQATAAAQGSTTSGQTGVLGQGAVTTAAPAYTTGQTSPLSLDTTGNQRVVDAADGATGAAPPSKALQNGTLQSGATGGQLKAVIQCDNHVFKHITTATDTPAINGVASQTIYVCGWRSRAAGVATWYLEESTGTTTCTALTQLTGVATEAANTGETVLSPFWTGLKTAAAAHAICINSTGTGGVDVDIWYTQF